MTNIKLTRIVFISILVFLIGLGIYLNYFDIVFTSHYYQTGYNNTETGTYDMNENGVVYFSGKICFLLAGLAVVFWGYLELQERY